MMKQQSEFLRLFLDITKALTASLDTKEIFDLIVNQDPAIPTRGCRNHPPA